jgi:hypothetical protein
MRTVRAQGSPATLRSSSTAVRKPLSHRGGSTFSGGIVVEGSSTGGRREAEGRLLDSVGSSGGAQGALQAFALVREVQGRRGRAGSAIKLSRFLALCPRFVFRSFSI